MKILGLFVLWFAQSYSVQKRIEVLSSEKIEPYIDHHSAVLKTNLRDVKTRAITPFAWMNKEESLINSASSRFVGSRTIKDSSDYIESEFRSLGLDVFIDSFPNPIAGAANARNIIGRLIGSTSESILVGAHYDDLPEKGVAPGADDNASGVSSMLSIAEKLSGTRLKRNVIFAAFSGEEQDLKGSAHFAASMAPSLNIVGAIIMDQDGNPGKSHGVVFESVGRSAQKQRIIDTLADSVDPEITSFAVNYSGFGSDHVSLSEAGIPAVLVIERDNMELAKRYGHTSKDSIGNIDMNFGGAIARTVMQAVVSLAMAP